MSLNSYGDSRPMESFRHRHRQQRAFIIGNGPSLHTSDLEKLKGEITFASNKIYLSFEQTAWRPTYYAVEDKLVMTQNYNRIKGLDGFVKFIPRYLNQWVPAIENAVYFDLKIKNFYPDQPGFSNDAADMICWGSNVSYTLIQIAAYMGIKEIYLIGIDHHLTLPDLRDPDDPNILISQGECNHFHPDYRKPGEKWFVPNLEVSIRSYEAAREALAAMGGKIYNASRGGKLEVFPRMDFDSVVCG